MFTKRFSRFRTLVYVVCCLGTILSVGVQQEVTEEKLTFSSSPTWKLHLLVLMVNVSYSKTILLFHVYCIMNVNVMNLGIFL